MPDQVTREEHQHLESRVAVLEGEVAGEKMVTRHILEQTRRNGDDLAAIRTRLDRHNSRLDGHDRRFDQLDASLAGLKSTLDGLIKALPTMIADVMRDVLREREQQR